VPCADTTFSMVIVIVVGASGARDHIVDCAPARATSWSRDLIVLSLAGCSGGVIIIVMRRHGGGWRGEAGAMSVLLTAAVCWPWQSMGSVANRMCQLLQGGIVVVWDQLVMRQLGFGDKVI